MNAVIYARYSSHSQTEQSIEGQLRDNYAWARQQGITVVGEYIDRALTGTKDARPDFQRMIADAAKKQFELVIVWKLDRFARNRYDSAIYKARLKECGVRVVSVKENIADTPEGIILEGLLEAMAEYYSANLSQNVRRGHRERAMNGLHNGGAVPYGYKLQDGKLIVDHKTAPVIRYVFEQYAGGMSKKKIVDELARRGIKNQNGKPFTRKSFHHALTNTAYIGQYKYCGEVVQGVAEPIIDEQTFNAVQQRIRMAARAPAANKAKVEYLLQGKAFCGECGAAMLGDSGTSHTGKVHNYYSCGEKKRHHTCKKKSERKGFIEWYIVEQTVRYVLEAGRASKIAKAVVAEYEKEFSNSKISELERAIAQIDQELNKLVDAIISAPKSAHAKIFERMEMLESQKADCDLDLSKLRIAHEIRLTEKEVVSWLKKLCDGDPLDVDFQKRIIDVFIGSVYLYDDRIIVFYNIRGGKQVSYIDLATSEEASIKGSDINANGVPNSFKSEPKYIFVNGVFGCIYYRNAEEK